MQDVLKRYPKLILIIAGTLVVLAIYIFARSTDAQIIQLSSSHGTSFRWEGNKISAFRQDPNKDETYKIWESESDIIKIDNVILYDVDKDGSEELVALVWTNADYFAERDYLEPIRGNLPSQHIRIYSIDPIVTLKWGGSTMQIPLTDFRLCGMTIQFLCGYASTYETFPEKIEQIALAWDGWSFELQDYPNYERYTQVFIAGETMLGRDVGKSIPADSDGAYLFDSFREQLRESALAIIPLENTFVPSLYDCGSDCMVLQGNSKYIQTLHKVGFDIAALASNHQGDAGQAGYLTTTQEVVQNNMQYTGVGKSEAGLLQPAISKVGNLTIGVISADSVKPEYWYKGDDSYSVNSFSTLEDGKLAIDYEKISRLQDIKKVNGINFLILHISWGKEYSSVPENYQQKLAHLLIDNGVDLIVGSHPHIVQDFEVYKNKYIFYSLGNFIFDQTYQDISREGLALVLYFASDTIGSDMLRDIKVIRHHACGPQQSPVNLADSYASGDISLQTLETNFDEACVYYLPIVK